jgi:hypothetical protein
MSKKSTSKSIDLSKTKKQDDKEVEVDNDGYDEDEEHADDDAAGEETELQGMFEKRSANTWADGGPKRDYVIGKLIKYFGSLVVREENEPDGTGPSEIVIRKAPNASINIVRARM